MVGLCVSDYEPTLISDQFVFKIDIFLRARDFLAF